MASCSGTSSGSSSQPPNSGSEEFDLQAAIDQKKRKRMLTNRESARRSRLRKQKHQDDLMAQASQLKKDNGQILAVVHLRTQNYLAVEAENSVLRTQMMELTSRLNSLNEILQCIGGESQMMVSDSFANPWSFSGLNQPIMAASDMIHYY
ncbi:Basic leucine zipper 63 [Platanthera zijinensis]|uniref:Basic leucine zipper 63 n=1 Tax=Platanthera zijinensis TaxID=2320716 RepID=A0AAP0BB86_9ASPA